LCGPKGPFIIDVVDMIFFNPWAHLEGLKAIEELVEPSNYALTIFDFVKQVFPHTQWIFRNSFQLPLEIDNWKYGQLQEKLV
jgi:hypothetical protein